MVPIRRFLPLALLLFAATALADELRWRSLDVTAKIDDDGTLHASETHTMIFDGEWNGGQRTIPLRVSPPPQRLTFDRVARVVSKKKTIDLTRVSDAPDRIDEYGVYNDGTTIRWRARLADDPPFRGKRITYIIDYTLTNVLTRRGAPLRLDHDFAPADRPGPIEHFSLIVELPESLNQPPIKIARDDIPPGEGVLVRETYWLPKGASAPAGLQPPAAVVTPPAPAPPKKAPSPTKTPVTPFTAQVIAFALLVLALLFVFRFFSGERAAGRFARVPRDHREGVDAFLAKLDAEVVGVAWDGVVGQDEVAAILARMTAEGKITSTTGASGMTLKLEVPFDSLRGYEADLIQALFLGKTETTTSAVRDYYAASGFDPARVVEHNLKSALFGLPQWEDQERGEWLVFWVLAALTCVLAIVGGRSSEVDAGMALVFGFLAILAGGLTLLCTIGAKRALTAVWVRFFFGLLVPFCSVLFAAVFIVQGGPSIPIHHLTAMMVASAALTVVALAVERMRIDQTRQKVEFRKSLAAAREWLKTEVATAGAPIPDRWIPYLYALRLADQYSWHVQRVPPPPVYSPVRQYYDIVPPQSSSMQSAAYAMEREAKRMRDERRRIERARDEMEREAKRASSFTSSWGSSGSRSSGSRSSSSSSSSSGRSSSTSGGGSAGGW